MVRHLLFAAIVLAGLSGQVFAQIVPDTYREEFTESLNHFINSQTMVDKAPLYNGGASALYDYLQSHIIYPQAAKQQGLSAQVFVTFTVDAKTGLPKDVKIEQSSNDLFNKEALRLVKSMPAWQPAVQAGKNISMILTLQVYFHLP